MKRDLATDPCTYTWLTSTLLADAGAVALDARIKPLLPSWRLFGQALTVEAPQGDNLAVHAALSIIQPGRVLVVAAGAYPNRSIMGGLMTRQALASGIAGGIVDGALRDTEELRVLGLPMFGVAAHPGGPAKNGGGSVGDEIVCGGARVRSGDWVYGDADGIVVFADADFDRIVQGARDKLEREQARVRAIEAGEVLPAWLPAALRDASDKVKMPS